MADPIRFNPRHATDLLRTDDPHVGLFDVHEHTLWISRPRRPEDLTPLSHARLLLNGGNGVSTPDKDRFLCYWFHTPGSGEGPVHGYPIEWEEGHLMIRLDPSWNHQTLSLIRMTDTARVEKNIDQQFHWGQMIYAAYASLGPKFPLSWHMIGPRPTDSMFYVDRMEAAG